jgi:hypothetical protein
LQPCDTTCTHTRRCCCCCCRCCCFRRRRLELSRGDWRAVKAGLDKARGLCAKGGDWERKNKLKVYEAVFLASTRQFKRAAELLLDAIATFTRCLPAWVGGARV